MKYKIYKLSRKDWIARHLGDYNEMSKWDKALANDLLATEPKEEKCCDNGNFGDGHKCLKSPPEIEPIEELVVFGWRNGRYGVPEVKTLRSIVEKLNQLIRHYNLERKI